MHQYFLLQYTLLSRKLRDAGIHPWLGFGIGLVAFGGFAAFIFYKTIYAAPILTLMAVAMIGKLSEIRRNEFLKTAFGPIMLKKIRMTENTILAIPFCTVLMIYGQFYWTAGLLVAAVAMALMSARMEYSLTVPTPFSKKPFEFIIGFRQTYALIVCAYILTSIAISVDNFNLGEFAVLLVFAISLNYYTKPEGEYFVWVHHHSPRGFLLDKIRTAMYQSALLVSPIVIALCIAYPGYIWIMLLLMVIGWAFLLFVITAKYAAYPGELHLHHAILFALAISFPPLLLALIPYFFIKSERRLHSYLA